MVQGGHAFSARAIAAPSWWSLLEPSQAKLNVLSRYLCASIYILYLNGIIKITSCKRRVSDVCGSYLLCFRFSFVFYYLYFCYMKQKAQSKWPNRCVDVLLSYVFILNVFLKYFLAEFFSYTTERTYFCLLMPELTFL